MPCEKSGRRAVETTSNEGKPIANTTKSIKTRDPGSFVTPRKAWPRQHDVEGKMVTLHRVLLPTTRPRSGSATVPNCHHPLSRSRWQLRIRCTAVSVLQVVQHYGRWESLFTYLIIAIRYLSKRIVWKLTI